MSEEPAMVPAVRLGDGLVYTGSCSWTERTLVQESDWYPERSMTAEERLRFYASRFPLVEVDSTYYAPPREQQARAWAQRTPDGFRFDVKAYSLLTGHPTRPQSLWSDVREQLPAQTREKRNVYPHHLSADALGDAWRRFELALRPLHEAGRLGAVLFQYPPWFTPRRESRAEIEALGSRLPDYRIAVEFRSPRWLAEQRDRERTLSLLEEHGLVFVCVDAPKVSGLPRLFAMTNPQLAIVRFHGRSDSTWAGPPPSGSATCTPSPSWRSSRARAADRAARVVANQEDFVQLTRSNEALTPRTCDIELTTNTVVGNSDGSSLGINTLEDGGGVKAVFELAVGGDVS